MSVCSLPLCIRKVSSLGPGLSTPPAVLLPRALAAVMQGQGMSPEDPNGVGLLGSAPTAGTLGGAAPSGLLLPPPNASVVTHPPGGRSLNPQSAMDVYLGMTGPASQPFSSSTPHKGLYPESGF